MDSGHQFPYHPDQLRRTGRQHGGPRHRQRQPHVLNEFVFSYTTDHITLIPTGAWQRPGGMTLGLFQNGFGGKVPGIALGGGIYDGLAEDPGYLPNGPYNSNPSYTYRDNVSKSVGKHNLAIRSILCRRAEERT